jgi:hypothetical protein
MWSDWGGKVIQISKAKDSPNRQKNLEHKQINGKFNDISSDDKNK